MEEKRVVVDKVEEDEDDFRSCCENEDELKEKEEHGKVESDENLDANLMKIYFKGVSVTCPGDSSSGIGVVMERPGCNTPNEIQKKLDFYVQELVAEYLALLDGLSTAIQQDMGRVFAFTDSELLHNQIVHDEVVENPLLVALRQRILEQASNVDSFVLKLVPSNALEKALGLARVAVGIVSFQPEGDGEESTGKCSICCEEKLSTMMLTIKCSHKFCSHCMKTYVEGKTQSNDVPIRCPQLGCEYCISAKECRLFLPVTSYESLERALADSNIIYCPYPSCSVLLDPHDYDWSNNSCVECPVCQRSICFDCGLTLHCPARTKRCSRMIELTHGCCHTTCCWCGSEYREGRQTCQCQCNDEYSRETAAQELEQWAWDSFESLPMMMDAYSDQERSQLAVIQRFLAGGFSFTFDEQTPHQSPPRCADSYADAMKDLHQLPWLERFVSVISDNYDEDYIQ